MDRLNELERQKIFIEKIIDSLPLGLYVIDRDFTIVAWNSQRESGEFGIQREKAIGKNVFQVFNLQNKSVLEEEFKIVFETGEPLPPRKSESWRNGLKRVYVISKIPMSLTPGEVTHVMTLGQEITKEESIQKELEAKTKLASIGLLAAGVAHEINNPLSLISTCAEGLLIRIRETTGPEDIDVGLFREYLETIEGEVERCKKITTGLLDFSYTGQAEHRDVNVNRLVEDLLKILKYHRKFKHLAVERRLDPDLPGIRANGDQLKQVFMGIMLNAMDGMAQTEAPVLEISTEKAVINGADCLVVVFKDNGCGIRPDHVPRLFDPFFTTKEIGKGVGLGLSVCWGIVRRHGGFIDVDSKPGEGSRFRIILPLQSSRDVFSENEKIPAGEPV
jgi:PAS domain S-box-containing protein